ncbi:type III-B CRISPR-associated protein Cas10/Cmr2 [Leptothermofonsia sichuanensis E412]|nr:type III-B CRISPR-associated protein Cas10/Cmr2 [Leptothermofonsia sichuanensis E412]
MVQALRAGKPDRVPSEVQSHVENARQLNQLDYPKTLTDLKAYTETYPQLWQSQIGLVYGGATKIKQYVFEAAKLPDIRGASALLDRINLVDLPAFFQAEQSSRFQQCRNEPEYCSEVRAWLEQDFPGLSQALIPELIIYSTGGNLLAFCPPAYGQDLANAIEKRYTQETLTANSCAVGDRFRLLELRFGRLNDPIDQTNWYEWYQQNRDHSLVQAYYGKPDGDAFEQFQSRKNFNELVTQLAIRFNQRRAGQDMPGEERPTRRYPPMLETHPYLHRDETERRSAVQRANRLPGEPWFSDVLARKRVAGQKSKRDNQNTAWFDQANWLDDWEPEPLESWVSQFERFLAAHPDLIRQYNPNNQPLEEDSKEARSLREIGNASTPTGFVAYIYADGNNMGGYIQKNIKTPEAYQSFSDRVSEATEHSVYRALAQHLSLHRLKGIDDAETNGRDGKWIHPFEILTIGGDDVLLMVPAHKALAIAQTLSEQFEQILLAGGPHPPAPSPSPPFAGGWGKGELCQSPSPDLGEGFRVRDQLRPPQDIHRYRADGTPVSRCQLSMSVGVLITAEDTPIYYAEKLVSQLLKSAKKKAKQLKKDVMYYGGTIDFLVMKSVTMLSSSIEDFRQSGLVIEGKPKLKLYGAPYTLHEIGGLLKTAKALKEADFPRSQLYQIRSLLEQGKHTAILNYRYFRARLAEDKQSLLRNEFENAWCQPKNPNNSGNLAPWMSLLSAGGTTYETIWRELVDLYPFTETSQEQSHPPGQVESPATASGEG